MHRQAFPDAAVTLAKPDQLSLAQQAALFQSASVLVLLHGAAIANWLFLPRARAH